MKITFGNWIVEDDFGIKYNDGSYFISKDKLWDTREDLGPTVSALLIHMAEKPWLTAENINDLNTSIIFAWDYFSNYKPADSKPFSVAQSLIIQKQYMEAKDKRNQEILLSLELANNEVK